MLQDRAMLQACISSPSAVAEAIADVTDNPHSSRPMSAQVRLWAAIPAPRSLRPPPSASCAVL